MQKIPFVFLRRHTENPPRDLVQGPFGRVSLRSGKRRARDRLQAKADIL